MLLPWNHAWLVTPALGLNAGQAVHSPVRVCVVYFIIGKNSNYCAYVLALCLLIAGANHYYHYARYTLYTSELHAQLIARYCSSQCYMI